MKTITFSLLFSFLALGQTTAPGAGAYVTRDVQDKLKDSLSVKDFGATGVASQDATPLIAAAIKAARAQGYGLYFPPGVYTTDPITDLQSFDHWYGSGRGRTFLKSRTGGNVISVNAREVDRTHLHDLTIAGTGKGNGLGISFVTSNSSSASDWHDMDFVDIGGTCLSFPNGFSLHFHDIVMFCGLGGAGNGFDIGASNTITIDNSYVHQVGSNSVAYRVHGGQFVCASCNGIDAGLIGANSNWGTFGNNTAEDGDNAYAFVELINPNMEAFTRTGARFKNGSCLTAIHGGKIQGPDRGTVVGMSFDPNPGCTGLWDNAVPTLGGGTAVWANGHAIHFTGVAPFFNIGGGLSGTGTGSNATTGWDDSFSIATTIPTETSRNFSNGKYATQFDRISLPLVYSFGLGTRGASNAPGIQQIYDGNCTPTDGVAHAQGEIAWNPAPAATGANAYMGCLCVSAGTPGKWVPFGSPRGNSYSVAAADIKVIAKGVNGCATANKCWQINGVLGPALVANASQSGISLPEPVGAGVYVRDVRMKTISACTGTRGATAGLGDALDSSYYVPPTSYNIQAAPGDKNIWPTAGESLSHVGASSDSSTTVSFQVNTTGGAISDLAVGCEVKVWVGYWIAQ